MNIDELVRKYDIDIEKLKREQLELSKKLEIRSSEDFSKIGKLGAISNIFIKNKILSCVVVCDKDYEIVDRAYFFDKARFPYIPGFRAYRELPAMVEAFDKLQEKPDVVFILGQGITHLRLGLASHFSLSVGVPTIGVANACVGCEAGKKDGEDIFREGKKVGKVLLAKPKSKPMFVSPGNLLSVDEAYKIARETIDLPHKRPEPLHLASKFSKEVKKELT